MPPGQAPEAVRIEWIGLEIPLPEQEIGGFQMGVLGGESTNEGGYQVDTSMALHLLEKKSPEAARWFYDNALLFSRFVFAKEVCELIE